MATFIAQAIAATFWSAGEHVMVSTAFGAPAILRREVTVKSEADAARVMADLKAELATIGRPYSLMLRLADKRAPNGFKSWPLLATRHDESFGQVTA